MPNTHKDPYNCYTCNSPVLPVDTDNDTYMYTAVHWGKEYLFCSLGCKYKWEGDQIDEDDYDAGYTRD